MRPDKFTSQLQEALADAQSLAVGRDHNYIEPVHLLHALLEQKQGSAVQLLAQAGADMQRLKSLTAQYIDRLPSVQNPDG
jgi:ATP-dependent Clp protease ATP-binding subunit ClpB